MTAVGPDALDMSRSTASRLAWLAGLAYLIFVAFQLSAPIADQGDVGRFLRSPAPDPRDALENALLMLPAGVLVAVALWLGGRAFGAGGLFGALLIAAAVAVPMELAQSYMPERSPSWWDAAMLILGGGAGYVAAWPLCAALGSRRTVAAVPLHQAVPLAVALLWPAWFWIPRRLELSADLLQAGWVPLAAGFTVDPQVALLHAVAWLAVAALLRQLVTGRNLPFAMAALVAVAWLGLLLSPGRALGWDALLGAVGALVAATLAGRGRALAVLFAATFVAALAGAVLAPFDLRAGFGLPAELVGRLDAAIAIGAGYPVLAAPLVLAAIPTIPRWRWAAVGLGAVVIGLAAILLAEWHGGGVAIPLALYGAGVVAFALGAWPAQTPAAPRPATLTESWDRYQAEARRGERGGAPEERAHDARASRHTFRPSSHRLGSSALRALAVLVLLVIGVWAVIQLPFMPYNLRELFEGRVQLASLPLFGLFLISASSAPPILASLLLRWPGLHIAQPLLYPVMATPVWLLLRYAVSAESLYDILGAPVLGWPGDWELYLRFLALAAVPLLSAAVWTLFVDGGQRSGWGRGLGHALLAAMMAVPWAVIAKLVVIDMASTDNLIELVAWEHGWLALAAIGLAVVLVALNGAVIGVSLGDDDLGAWVVLAVLTAVLAVASWGLVSFALAPGALDFLLGTRRGIDFAMYELLLLWSALHVAAAAALGVGRWIVGPLVSPPATWSRAAGRHRAGRAA